MPYNGSGSFLLAQAAFVPATPISSSAMNSDLSDIATNGLTDAVAKDGQTTITGAFKGASGTVSLPMYSFSADLDCGMYRIGANNIGIAVGGVKILDISASGLSVKGSPVVAGVVVQKFTSSGTYTPTAGMKYCIIECIGGGGAGGAGVGTSVSLSVAGGGGGSGGYSRKYSNAAAIGTSQSVTIGVGGAAGGGTGGGGGVTALGSLCGANGGNGGVYSQAAVQVPYGGAGASTGVGDLTVGGNPGGPGYYNNDSTTILVAAGNGGSSYFGGAPNGVSNTQAAGTTAGSYGNGGSGGCAHATASTFNGGGGSAGLIVITEFL